MSNHMENIHRHIDCTCTDDAQSLTCPMTPNWCTCLFSKEQVNEKCNFCEIYDVITKISVHEDDTAISQQDNQKDDSTKNKLH